MNDIFRDFFNVYIDGNNKEEILFTIFEFLSKHIPFEVVSCASVNRHLKRLTVFLEYSLNERTFKYSYPLDNVSTDEAMEKVVKKGFHKTQILGNEIPLTHFTQFPYPIKSILYFIFNVESEEDSIMYFACHAKEKNIFNKKHIEIIESLRPYLEIILSDLYINNNNEFFTFSASLGTNHRSYEDYLTSCPNMHKTMRLIKVIAPYDNSVLIEGPTGSGKEIVASTLHALSPRNTKPFVIVNCAAIPESLLESEFFGSEKGAFTSATQTRKGFFEQANSGVLFLDEVGELSPPAQAALLRALESKKIQRIGGSRLIPVDIRIIAATHRNLRNMIAEGKFREDLYYRLRGFTIEIPPLTERRKDLLVLIDYFYSQCISKLNISTPPKLTALEMKKLQNYHWPGNVRELRAIIEEGVFKAIAEEQTKISVDTFFNQTSPPQKRKPLSYDEIINALETCKGKIQGANSASEFLKVNYSTLRSRMKFLGISVSQKS